MLAIFIEGGGADAVQFAAGQHRLEHIAGVHRAFGFASTDHRMDFVDEKNDLALGFRDFLEDGFQALFEFTAIFCAGNQRAQIQRDEALVLSGCPARRQ